MTYRVKLDSDACIGCVACTRCNNFIIGEDMKAHPVNIEVRALGLIREVADLCPVNAIKVIRI